MAALTTGSWTIAYRMGTKSNSTVITNRKKFVSLKLTLTTGEAPATGVPLPNFGSCGMVRYLEGWTFDHDIDSVLFTTALGRGIKWVLNTTGNKLVPLKYVMASAAGSPSGGRVLRALATTVSITGAKVFYATARGW